MQTTAHRPKLTTLIILITGVVLTFGLMTLTVTQDERGVWHLEGLGGSIIYLNDSRSQTTLWIYWDHYYVGKWTFWSETSVEKTPYPTNTPYPTATPYPTSTPSGQLSARIDHHYSKTE